MHRILVVDDEPQVRDLTSRALRKCDLRCDTAADGDEAMHRFELQAYDTVVTDLRMPRKHGHSLAVELLGKPSPPKVMVVTGLADPRLVRDLIGRGVEDVLHKPVDYDVLAMKVLAIAEKSARDAPRPSAVGLGAGPKSPAQILKSIEKSLVELTDIFDDSLAGVFEFDDELNEPPKSVSDFITRFGLQEEEDATIPKEVQEARAKERVRCHTSAVAVPVTRRFAPDGEPFRVAIRDVSESGIRLLHTRATNAKYLALSWNAEALPATELRVVAKLMRCKPLSPFYDIGGQFVMAD
ncbi:MAG: response regulator [Planctomycetota bacterium]